MTQDPKEQNEELDVTLASLLRVLPTDHFCDHCLSQIKESISQIVNAQHNSGNKGRSFYQPWKGIRVSPTEYKVLEALYRNQGRRISTPELVTLAWGSLDRPDDPPHALRQMIYRLRKNKLAGTPYTIDSSRRGYQMVVIGDEPEELENLEDDPWSL